MENSNLGREDVVFEGDNKEKSGFVGVPDIRDKQKTIFANIFSVVSTLVSLAFAASSGISESGLVFLSYSFLVLINYLIFLASKRVNIYNEGVVFVAAAAAAIFMSKGGYVGFLWFFMFPYAAYFLTGLKKGSFYSATVAIVSFLALFTLNNPAGDSGIKGYDVKFCFVSVYAACCVLALAYEAARQDAREKLIEANINMNSRSAEQDALTGLLTGVQIRDRAFQEAARYDRFQRPFCFLRCNIDCFGIINEKYGFDCGDNMLKGVAEKMNAMLRETDLAARWGGSEFLVMLSETTVDRAMTVAERIRKSIEEVSWGWKNKRLNLTVSLGLSLFDPAEGVDGSIRIADERAVKAGKFGGNRVECPPMAMVHGKNA